MATSPSDLPALRARYAREVMVLAERAALPTARIEPAFAAVPREAFLTPPPWRVLAPGGPMEDETADPARLYRDVLVVLDAPKRINNGQPSLHAAWMAGADPRPGETVVQIGIGSGYYTAVLAELVGEGGRIEAYEIEPRLASIARENLRPLLQVSVHAASAVGTALPSADLVYVSAGVVAPDPAWLESLSPGGRMICPWQPMPGAGHTLSVTRGAGGFRARLHGTVWFVACVGAGREDARPDPRMPDRHLGETRSVWLTADRSPDESATAVYRQVWFSSEPIPD